MKPYYEHGGITIYHGEVLNTLAAMQPSDIGAVIADPPYSSGGMFRADRSGDPASKYSLGKAWPDRGGVSHKPQRVYGSFAGDSRDQRSYLAWCSLWLSQCWRVAKPTAQSFICTDWRQLPVTADAVQAGGWTWRGVCVWDKGVGRPMRGRFRNHLEYIVWASHGAMPEAADVYPSTLLKHAPPRPNEREHVTQKPVELIRELLSVAPDGSVLEPFMGSGTTLVAAYRCGRKAIGIEIEERYCEIAAKRLQQETLPLEQPA